MKKYRSCLIILICALLLAACAPEPEVIIETTYESVPVEVTRIVEVPVIEEVIVVETVEVEILVTPSVIFPTKVPEDLMPLTQFGDGIWLIGTEIVSGIYKNIGPVGIDAQGNSMCHWKVYKCFGGWRCNRDYEYTEFYNIVKMQWGDVMFSSIYCGEWIKVD